MRKLIIAATTIAALAVPTIAPALASASVDRYQVETGTLTSHVAYGDLSSVHTYKVTINPCDNTFTGNDGSSRWAENEQITSGTINGSDITFHATYPSGYSWDVASGGNGSDVDGRTFEVTNDLTHHQHAATTRTTASTSRRRAAALTRRTPALGCPSTNSTRGQDPANHAVH